MAFSYELWRNQWMEKEKSEFSFDGAFRVIFCVLFSANCLVSQEFVELTTTQLKESHNLLPVNRCRMLQSQFMAEWAPYTLFAQGKSKKFVKSHSKHFYSSSNVFSFFVLTLGNVKVVCNRFLVLFAWEFSRMKWKLRITKISNTDFIWVG